MKAIVYIGDFFSKNITLKMGQCPANSYIDFILKP